MQEALDHHPMMFKEPRDINKYRNITDRGLLVAFVEYIGENGVKTPEGVKKINQPQALVMAALAFLFDANRDEDWVPLIIPPKQNYNEVKVDS